MLDERTANGHGRLLLFDLDPHGHHPGFIQALVQHWSARPRAGELFVLVAPKFLDRHADVVESVRGARDAVRFVTATSAEIAGVKAAADAAERPLELRDVLDRRLPADAPAAQQWRIMCRHAAELGAWRCLLLDLDTCLPAVAAGLKAPCRFAGIYHSPPDVRSEPPNGSSTGAAALRLHQRFLLSRVLEHAQLETLFFLDPRPFEQIDRPTPALVQLPTPVRPATSSAGAVDRLCGRLGIDRERQVFLMFGDLSERKGIFQLAAAVSLLPAELCRRLCVAFVGRVVSADRDRLTEQLARLRRERPVQVVESRGFVRDAEVRPYFDLADVILIPSHRRTGTSGVLALAAAAGKPVLGTAEGTVGATIAGRRLGLTVNAGAPDELARGLTRFLTEPPESLFDAEAMRALAAENSADAFAAAIFERLAP